MLQQDRIHTLRQTHSAVTTMMPLITAGLAVTGALIGAIETRGAAPTKDERQEADTQPLATTADRVQSHHSAPHAARAERRVTVRRYIATLAGRLLLVLLGVALVLAITIAATTTGRVGQAITITALILLTLYLVEKITRQP